MFEQIVFQAAIERSLLSPRTGPLARRVLKVAELAGHDRALGRRLSTLLDARAPWTR